MKTTMVLLAILFMTACSPNTNDPSESLDSGIEVQVLIGPMCPVVQIGTDCPDQPYQAALTIINSSGQEVMQFETDELGRYKAYLEPGQYTLHPESPEGAVLPRAGEQSFTVEAHQFTRIVVNYDSGIR